MKFDLRLALVGGLALASVGMTEVASAMPAAPLNQAIATPSDGAPAVENVYYYRYYRYYRPYYRYHRYYHRRYFYY